jgi:hypothetical protein
MDDVCGDSQTEPKRELKAAICRHLGWENLKADTYPGVVKFNLWHFYVPNSGTQREVETRRVPLKITRGA